MGRRREAEIGGATPNVSSRTPKPSAERCRLALLVEIAEQDGRHAEIKSRAMSRSARADPSWKDEVALGEPR